MKKKKLKYEHKASARDYLIALAYHSNFTHLLEKSNKPYMSLVDWLLEKEEFLKDDSSSFPSIKQISVETGISSGKIAKYLKAIYEDILSLNDEKPGLFKKEGQILCGLSFNYLGNYHLFNAGLDAVPRVGDYFTFLFIEPQVGGRGFHVTRVFHNLDYDGQQITIGLSSGSPNLYLKLLKEKAYLHREISFNEYFDNESDSEFQEKLLSIYDKL